MWLFVEYLIGLQTLTQVFHFSYARENAAYSDPCIAKILLCDLFRQPFSLHKEKGIGMFAKIEDLNKACGEQAAYMLCIVRAEKFCKQATLLHMTKEMLNNRRFPAEVCRHASPWQQLYLKEANCLNAYSKKIFFHCFEKIKRIVGLSPGNTCELGCKYGAAVIDCSATALQKKCGFYAGIILKRFLKFHILSDYKCFNFKPEDVEDYFPSSTSDYDLTEEIFNVLETAASAANFYVEATERTDNVNANFEKIKLNYLENQASTDESPSKEGLTIFNFDLPDDDESLLVEYFFLDSLDSDADSKDMVIEPDKFEFPSLPNYHYVHTNRTTFALYEDLEMGHMKLMGCGEADIFWVILSPLESKYCTLTDLKSEYSEAIFKCTVRMDTPCSSKLDDEDRNKKAEVFHRRYVATVMTPPNNQRSEDMAIMNVHYLKLYPSMHIPEKKVSLWTAEANEANIEQTVERKGSLEMEEEQNDILYERSNGSGRKTGEDVNKYSLYSDDDDDEYDEEYENWDYYPLEEDDDIYFPEMPMNNIIYIEDNNGDLISLHDHRSPIYSNSLYKPHTLFRPRFGAMLPLTDPQNSDEIETNQKKKLGQSSVFKEKISEFSDEFLVSKYQFCPNEDCSTEAPYSPNSESISIQNFEPLNKMNRLFRLIPSSTKLYDDMEIKNYLGSRKVYVVTSSAKIKIPEFIESDEMESHNNEFVTDRSSYQPEEVENDNIDITSDYRYLNPDHSSSLTSAPDSDDSKLCFMEPLGEYNTNAFTHSPYKDLDKHTDKVNSEGGADSENLKSELSSDVESLWDKYLTKIFKKISKVVFKSAEKTFERGLFDEVFITILENAEHTFNF